MIIIYLEIFPNANFFVNFLFIKILNITFILYAI